MVQTRSMRRRHLAEQDESDFSEMLEISRILVALRQERLNNLPPLPDSDSEASEEDEGSLPEYGCLQRNNVYQCIDNFLFSVVGFISIVICSQLLMIVSLQR